MKNNKCPCVDCITLSICKAFMSDRFGFSGLSNRCSLFRDRYTHYFISDNPERIFLLSLFKPIAYKNRIKMANERRIRGGKELEI